jgi:aminopeptidase N
MLGGNSLVRSTIMTALLLTLGLLMTAAATALDERAGRLPDGVLPVHYDIRIEPDPQSLVFEGRVSIDVEVREATRLIVLNAADLEIASATLDGAPVADIELDGERELLRLRTAGSVSPGRHRIVIDYSGRIHTTATALFAVDYDSANGPRRMLSSQFQPADGRRFAPMWDEPSAKASFTLEVLVPAGQSAFSNMPVAQAVSDGERTRVRFATSPRMSSYLLHLSIGELDREAWTIAGVDVGIVTRKGAGAKGRYALEATTRILPWFNDYFGSAYPLPKLDMIAVPGSSQFFGAMENWGAIMYFEPYLLLDPQLSATSDRHTVFSIVAHEVAHQWFGNLVTMQWWDDLWLNEGFASWMETRIETALLPQNKPAMAFVGNVREFAMARDASAATRPIVQPVPSVDAANQTFDAIAYAKGPVVLHMLESVLGEQAFRDGIRAYMARHAYGSTVTDQLWAELAAASGQPVADIAHDFTRQPGVPLVSVVASACDQGMTVMTLEQGRFETGPKDPARYTWRIPVRIRSVDGGAVTTVLLGKDGKPATATLPGCGDFMVNAGQSGYFRTRYTEAQWQGLQARFDSLEEIDRLGLLNDAWALGQAGELPVTRFLNLAAQVSAGDDPLILMALARAFTRIDRLFDGSAQQQAWRSLARSRLQPAFARIGWLPAKDESDNVALLRETLIRALGRLDDATLKAQARQRFERASGAADALPASIRTAVIDVVAGSADATLWQQLRERADAASEPMEQRQWWSALGAADDPALALRALQLALTQDSAAFAMNIINRVAREHPELAFDYAVQHRDAVLALVEATQKQAAIPMLAAYSSEPALADRVLAYAERYLPADARKAADTAVADIRFRAEVKAREMPVLERWLQSR